MTNSSNKKALDAEEISTIHVYKYIFVRFVSCYPNWIECLVGQNKHVNQCINTYLCVYSEYNLFYKRAEESYRFSILK